MLLQPDLGIQTRRLGRTLRLRPHKESQFGSPDSLSSSPGSATCWLCEASHAAEPLPFSAFTSAKWASNNNCLIEPMSRAMPPAPDNYSVLGSLWATEVWLRRGGLRALFFRVCLISKRCRVSQRIASGEGVMGTYCVYLGEETGLGGAAASMRIKCQQVKVTISVINLPNR